MFSDNAKAKPARGDHPLLNQFVHWYDDEEPYKGQITHIDSAGALLRGLDRDNTPAVFEVFLPWSRVWRVMVVNEDQV